MEPSPEALQAESELLFEFVCLTDELVRLGLSTQGSMLPYHVATLLFRYKKIY